jgi:hypothetical protein
MAFFDSEYFPFLMIALILFISWNVKYNRSIDSADIVETTRDPKKRLSTLRKYLRIQKMMGV